MLVAFLADIHGNLPALEAVLDDLDKQRPDAVYLVGDQINRCPWNIEVLDCLQEKAWPAIMGNHELVVGRIGTDNNRFPFTDRSRFPILWWTWQQLSPQHLEHIRALPPQRLLEFDPWPAIRLLHGVPDNPFVGFYDSMQDAEMTTQLASVMESHLVVGHTHRPMIRRAGRWMVYNGGSVGMPYNGDTAAQYLLLEGGGRGAVERSWIPHLRRVEYDHAPIPNAFVSSGLAEAVAPFSELVLRTVMDGEPWVSDFGHWVKSQPPTLLADWQRAVSVYLMHHGPHNWAFTNGSIRGE